MAEFPVAAAAIGLTVTTFTLCVQALQLLGQARKSANDMLGFGIAIDMEISRLIIWGQNSGISNGKLDPSLEPVRSLIDRVLGALLATLRDAQALASKYGIQGTIDAEIPSAAESSQNDLDKVDILALPLQVVRSALAKHRDMCLKLKKQSTVAHVTTWTIKDAKKARSLIKAVKSFVDGLDQLLTESQRASLDAEATAVKIAILGTSNWKQPAKALAAIENATSGLHESIALPARLSRLRLEWEMETAAPTVVASPAALAKPLSLPQTQIRPLDFSRSVATFDGRELIIEWHHLLPGEESGEAGQARARQAARLAQLFQELRGHEKEYAILECVGFVDNRYNLPPRLGIAFAMPSITPSPPHSLHDYLSSKEFETFLPPLGERFELARKIAGGFLQFFQLGWHHKCIRSHFIGFFPSTAAGNPSIHRPYIMGFAYSRPHEHGISDQERHRTPELELYTHPEYQYVQEPGRHRLLYDMYSIGMLLFEIGMWRPLRVYFSRMKREDESLTTVSFGAKLLERESANLEFRMGRHFKDAVAQCLTGGLGMEISASASPLSTVGENLGNQGLKLAYFERVVKALDVCQA
ncbi:prion-inhibition and propagation domain containing protein [Rhypophila decipiens]